MPILSLVIPFCHSAPATRVQLFLSHLRFPIEWQQPLCRFCLQRRLTPGLFNKAEAFLPNYLSRSCEKCVLWTLPGVGVGNGVRRSDAIIRSHSNLPEPLHTFLCSVPRQAWRFNSSGWQAIFGPMFQPNHLSGPFLGFRVQLNPWASQGVSMSTVRQPCPAPLPITPKKGGDSLTGCASRSPGARTTCPEHSEGRAGPHSPARNARYDF